MSEFTPIPNSQNATASTPEPNSPVWIVKASGGSEPVPNGAYLADFEDLKAFNKPELKLVDKFRWTWTIANGKHAAKKASALTDQEIKSTTLAGRLLSGMLGRPLIDGENVFALVNSLKGKRFLITIANGPKGGQPQVQSANRPPE